MEQDFEINYVDFPSEKRQSGEAVSEDSTASLPRVKIAPRKPVTGKLVAVPDGKQPVPLGSGVVTSIIGEGGVAIVYEIWNERLGISRAVKLLRPNHSTDARNRFETEMKMLAQLHHPNIIEIHAVGEWNELPYIEMERIYGTSLFQLLRSRGALPVEVCCAAAIMVCRALSFTHTKEYMMNGRQFFGILHRDLKPANIMISNSGLVKIMDFGIATPTHVSMHTVEGTVVGSLNYMAPEQISERDMDSRTDIYALGCVMYEMLTGKKAFPQRTIAELIPKKMKGNYVPLSYYRVKIPKRLNALISRCIDSKKERRYEYADEILQELEKIYKSMSNEQPEELISRFIKNETQKVTLGRKPSFWLLTVGTPAVVLSALLPFLIIRNHAHEEIKKSDAATVAAIKPVPGVTSISDEQTLATSLIDSAAGKAAKERYPAGKIKGSAPAGSVTQNTRGKNSGTEQKQELTTKTRPAYTSQALDDGLKAAVSVKTTSDQAAISVLEQAITGGDFNRALRIYSALPSEIAGSKRALLYKMRALYGIGNRTRLISFLESNDIPDQEFYIAKSRSLYEQRRIDEAIQYLERCSSVPAEYSDKDMLEKEVLYWKALCYTVKFEQNGTPESRKKALEMWMDVKYAFQHNQSHIYYEKANTYLRQLSE